MARRKASRDETWYSGKTHDVHGKLGHQDGQAKAKHVAKILDDHNTHRWQNAAFLRKMSGLPSTASFESVESRFSFNKCLRQGSVETPRLWQKMTSQILANMEEEWMMKREGALLDVEEGVHQICRFMLTDNFWIMSHSKEHLEQMLKKSHGRSR